MELFLPGAASVFNPLLPMYGNLWNARLQGTEALHRALEDSLRSDLPRERAEILADLASSGWLGRRASARQVRALSPYRLFTPLPYDDRKASRHFVRDRLLAYAGGGLVPGLAYAAGLATSWPHVLVAALGALTAGVVAAEAAHTRRNARNAALMAEWLKPGSDAPDVAVFLTGALKAAFDGSRSAEVHYLALAAGRSYVDGSADSPEGALERRRLQMMAQIRGSHHAAHALWLIRQETGLSGECDLGQWSYEPALVWRSLCGDVAALEAVNLAVRESAAFRENYIADMRRRGQDPRDDANLQAALEASEQTPA